MAVAVLTVLGSLIPAQAQQSDNSKTTDNPDSGKLDRVVVTVNKRAELVENVAASVSVMSERFIERNNIKDFDDLVNYAPSITLSPSTNNSGVGINMRGIGTIQYGMGTSPDVAIVVNDIPIVLQGAAFQDLADVQRVEILKGPQSTLFGRSAIAGAMVITSKPAGGLLGGSGSAVITSDGEHRIKAAYGGTVSDGFAYRVAASESNFPGNVNNLTDGSKVNGNGGKTFMSRFLWTLTPDLDVEISPRYNWSKSTCCALVFSGLSVVDPTKPIGSFTVNGTALTPLVAGGATVSGDPSAPGSALYGINVGRRNVDIRNDYPNGNTNETVGSGLRVNRRFDSGSTLSYIAGFERSKSWDVRDQDFVDLSTLPFMKNGAGQLSGMVGGVTQNGINDSRAVTQELRLTSPDDGAVRYVAGLWYSYFNTYRHFARGVTGLSITSPVEMDVNNPTTQIAAYANANWDFSPGFTLEGGLRLNREISGYTYSRSAGPTGVYSPTVFLESQDNAENAITGKLSLRYQFTKDLSGYVLHTTGYKGMAYDITSTMSPAVSNPVASETAKNYELGLKGNFLEDTLSMSFAAFNTTFNNWQQKGTSIDETGVATGNVLLSIPKVTTQGVELDMSAVLSRRLRLNFGLALTDAHYGTYLGSCYTDATNTAVSPGSTVGILGGVAGRNSNCTNVPTKSTTGVAGVTPLQDIDGMQLVNAPKVKVNIGGQYDLDMGTLPYKVFLTGSMRYVSERQQQVSMDPRFIKPAEKITNIGMGISDLKEIYKLSLFVNNLFDEQYGGYLIYNNSGGVIGNALVRTWTPNRDAFRYFGARFDMKF